MLLFFSIHLGIHPVHLFLKQSNKHFREKEWRPENYLKKMQHSLLAAAPAAPAAIEAADAAAAAVVAGAAAAAGGD